MNKCLLIIDVQNGFINAHTKHIPKLVEELQGEYANVFVTRFFNKQNSFYRTLIKWHRLGRDSVDFNLAFVPRDDAIIIDKNVYSCVTAEFLEQLSQKNIKQVDVCGIDTDTCVTKCAVDLFEANIKPQILARYCASHAGKTAHKNALDTLGRFIGREQVTT